MVYDMADDFERTGTFKRYTNLPRRYTWRSWNAMMRRCHDAKFGCFRNYGGRGIRVIERWHKFDNFIEDMGLRPKNHIISRKDHNKDYSKDNCLWEHRSLNGKGTRVETAVTINGKTQSITEWSRESGILRETLKYRVRSGWPAEQLLKPGKYALAREPAEDILSALFEGVDFESGAPTLVIKNEVWIRVKKFMSACQHLIRS